MDNEGYCPFLAVPFPKEKLMSAGHDNPIPPCGPDSAPQTCEHAGPWPQDACVTVSVNFAQARVGQTGGKSGPP